MSELWITWAVIVALPLIASYFVGKTRRTTIRRSAFWALASLPVWGWTVVELVSPPTWPSDHFDRWSFGMVLLVPVMFAWIIAAIIGFSLGRRKVR
jgi:hypothetical protein